MAGGVAAVGVLKRRHRWEAAHKRVAICVDYDDAQQAAIRAGITFDVMLTQLAEHGATHLGLPEITLARLQQSGLLAPRVPARPRKTPPPAGHWNYLHGPTELVTHLAAELAARMPHTRAQALAGGMLVFGGDLPTIGEIGLGFDAAQAEQIAAHGLGIVPRPVSYAWPEKDLLESTLAQAARLGNLVAFDGDMILGHEMHLEETLAAMTREDLSLVYFTESRHQKGDWFVAKRRAPHVVLAHRFTAQEMIPLDSHTASHVWAHLARERGIRLCYVNFFKVLHATEPLEGLHYVKHIKGALEHHGFEVSADVGPPTPVPTPSRRDRAVTGLTAAGVASAAASAVLNLPESLAVPATVTAAAGAAALPYLERPRGRLEEHYPPSYAPKALALATAALAPVALSQPARAGRDGVAGWGAGIVMQVAAAASLAALTSGQDYHLRVEEFKGLGLDWLLPLAAATRTLPGRGLRVGALAALAGLWQASRRADLLAQIDPAHAEGHTHHLSAAQRIVGDLRIRLGPQPARKWAGLGAFGSALALALTGREQDALAGGAALAGAVGAAMGLVGFRQPARALAVTAREALPSFGVGAALGLLVLLASGHQRDAHTLSGAS